MQTSSQLHSRGPQTPPETLPPAVRLLSVLWPAFLMAGVTEIVVFAMVDPQFLHWPDGHPFALSSQGVYTLAFLFFWAINALTAALVILLDRVATTSGQDEGPRSL